MNDVDLTALRAEGSLWFEELAKKWEERTGYEPVAVADELKRIDRRQTLGILLPVVISIIGIIIIIILTAMLGDGDDDFTLRGLFLATAFGVVVLGLGHLFANNNARRKDRIPIDARLFGPYLKNFLDWVGQTPRMLNMYDQNELRQMATEVLVGKAMKAIALQIDRPSEKFEEWGKES